ENITTGSGSDTITDNEVDNIINTGAGDDKIYVGNGGYDTIDGGLGIDIIYLDISKDDINLIYLENQTYLLDTPSYVTSFVNIEILEFQDGLIFSPDMLI
ncbi:MAG: hypothetical protein U9N59_15850, partial [Campylobacterota bacterium]|nr:hypothetical protein [Campylobacterota bacterium]